MAVHVLQWEYLVKLLPAITLAVNCEPPDLAALAKAVGRKSKC